MPERQDIQTRADCEALVRAFYGRAMVDPIIGFLFTDVARLDLEAHIPRITNFWDTILLGARNYGGGAFRPHVELHFKVPLTRGHFDRWVYLWTLTVDELFAGERAELAKSHAARVAAAFESRLRSFDRDAPDFAPGIPDEEQGFELPLVHQYGRAPRD